MDGSSTTGHTLGDGRHANHGYLWCVESSIVPRVGPVVALELLEEQMAEPPGSLLGEEQKAHGEVGQSFRESEAYNLKRKFQKLVRVHCHELEGIERWIFWKETTRSIDAYHSGLFELWVGFDDHVRCCQSDSKLKLQTSTIQTLLVNDPVVHVVYYLCKHLLNCPAHHLQ